MRVYILDMQCKSREQITMWLTENERVDSVEVFEDYICFTEHVLESPPDFCFVRVGRDGIPGLKTVNMVKQISSDIQIIFISDNSDYALDAYEVGANGYLLCPIRRDKLEKYLMMKKEM